MSAHASTFLGANGRWPAMAGATLPAARATADAGFQPPQAGPGLALQPWMAKPLPSEWKGLVAERWTLVDLFESDGTHYLVARRNDTSAHGLDRLSPREKQALGLLAQGRTNKLIAYELGLSHSTVGVLLHRAARKLQVRSRLALIAAFQAATSDAP